MYFKNRRSLQLSTRMVELILSVCRKLLPLKCLLGVVPLKLLLVNLYILIYGVHYLLLANRQNMLLTQSN